MLELASRYEEALSTYEEMESLGREWGERSIELAAMLARITPLATVTAVFDPEGAEDLAKRALELARALGDQIAEVTILWKQLIIYRYTNRLMEAIPHGERALALARKLGLRERTAFILQDVGYCFGFMADFAPAQRHIREAGAMWQELGDLPMLMDTLMASCAMCGFAGRYDEAIAYFEESLTISQKIGTVWALAGCRHNIGFVLADRGEVERAIAEMEEGIRLSEQVSFMSPLVVVRTDLARLFGALGALEPAIELARLAVLVAGAKVSLFRGYALPVLTHLLILQGNLAEARESVHEMETDPNRDGWGVNAPGMFQVQTELALAEGRYDEAAKLAADAVTVARREGVRAFLPSALDLQARAYLELGQREAARDGWLEARREAEALGARLRLWPILLALCRLEHDPNVAASLQTQARGVVAYIADRSPPDLQTSFLAMPAVQEALNAP
jgi:tetratricopeptide (TPR) repeat protein